MLVRLGTEIIQQNLLAFSSSKKKTICLVPSAALASTYTRMSRLLLLRKLTPNECIPAKTETRSIVLQLFVTDSAWLWLVIALLSSVLLKIQGGKNAPFYSTFQEIKIHFKRLHSDSPTLTVLFHKT